MGIHYVGDCGPGGLFPSIFGSLGVGDRSASGHSTPTVSTRCTSPTSSSPCRSAGTGTWSVWWTTFPGERGGLRAGRRHARAVAEESRARSIPGAETPTFDRWAFRTLDELFAEGELSQRAQAVLDHWSGLYAGGPSQTAVAMHASIIDHYMRGAYYPEGGGQMMPARLIQVIEAFGGEVRTLSPVERIVVEDRHATGVELDDGATIARNRGRDLQRRPRPHGLRPGRRGALGPGDRGVDPRRQR